MKLHRVIGIDFGTSTTYMNVKRYNGDKPAEDAFSYMPVMFNYGESSGFVASIIRENVDGSFDFGEKAAEEMDGAKIYTEIKMHLENPDEAQRNEARRIVKAFFKFLYATYSQQAVNLGSADDTEETIVSYPVKWQAETAEFMLEAAREAGFQNVRGMDEATAAISTVLVLNAGKDLVRADKPGYLLLVDMGAGTTDLVVCRYQADDQGKLKVELVSNWPRDAHEPTFGGRELDRVLEGYVEAYLSKALKPEMAPFAHGLACTPGAAKKWKEFNVSVNLAANRPVTTCSYAVPQYIRPSLSCGFPEFDRQVFESFARDCLQDYVRLIEGCLTDTSRKDEEFDGAGVDLVILTGGHSAWYFAREIVDGTMDGYLDHPSLSQVREKKDHVVNLPNPQITVSQGLVYSKLPFNLKKAEEKPASPIVQQLQGETDSTSETTGHRDWYQKILPVLREVVSTEPSLIQTNRLDDKETLSEIQDRFSRAHTRIPGNQIILYAGLMGTFPARAILLTEMGIYRCQGGDRQAPGQVSFMTWRQFANSVISRPINNKIEFGYEGEWIQFYHDDVMDAMIALYDRLRETEGIDTATASSDLLEVVEDVLSKAPDLRESNRADNQNICKKMSEHFRISSGERILYANSSDNFGTMMTGRGIYQWATGSTKFMTWEEFARSKVADDNYQTRQYLSRGNWIISTLGLKNRTGLAQLYKELRIKAGISQYYGWDPRLLSYVKQFIQANPALLSRPNCLSRYQSAQLLSKLELSHMCGDEVYFAADNYSASLLGRNKEIITSSGFGLRYYSFLMGYSGDIITWEEFMEADLNDANSRASKVLFKMRLTDEFATLQRLLRDELAKLNKKCV